MRYFFFALLFLLFLCGSTLNYICIWKRSIKKEKYASVAPLISGLAGAISFYLAPYHIFTHYTWLPLLVDPGCALYMTYAFIALAKETYLYNRYFIITRLHSVDLPDTSVTITLYKNNDYILKKKCYDSEHYLSVVGQWLRQDNVLEIFMNGQPIIYLLTASDEANGETIRLLKWSNKSTTSVLDNIDLQVTDNRF